MTTTWPSRVSMQSSSNQPARICEARSNAASVFSGAYALAPRWAITPTASCGWPGRSERLRFFCMVAGSLRAIACMGQRVPRHPACLCGLLLGHGLIACPALESPMEPNSPRELLRHQLQTKKLLWRNFLAHTIEGGVFIGGTAFLS